MAKGSTRSYGGWEIRMCAHCGAKLTHATGGCYSRPILPDGSFGAPWSTCTTPDCMKAKP